MNKFLIAIFALLLLLGSSGRTWAQTPAVLDGGRPQLTRTELQEMLGRVEQLSGSADVSAEIRSQAGREAATIRSRLETGDLRVGDQVALVVEGEQALTETFTVRPGQILTLPGIGDISVAGVLRSELQGHMATALSRYIQDPVVHAESLVRVTITGQVARPGFYGVRPEQLLSDAIMEAGGPAAGANLEAIHIERAGEQIWSGAYLQMALAEGRTLDQLSLRAGDQIVVPARRQGAGMAMLGVVTGALSSIAILVTMLR